MTTSNNYRKEDPATIQSMFGSIAKDYDRTNALLSLCMHKYWNAKLVKLITQRQKSEVLLDLCAGTGEIAFQWLKRSDSPKIAFLLDFCPEMLEYAKKKSELQPFGHHQIDFIQADAECIPLPDNSIDSVTIAYGIRNVSSPEACFKEVQRVLKPGGTFGILEATVPSSSLLKPFHRFYLRKVLPLLGELTAKNKQAYQYLCNSIQSFAKPEELKSKLAKNNFDNITLYPLTGGIATIILASKTS